MLQSDSLLKNTKIIDVEIRPYGTKELKKKNIYLPILNPSAKYNPKTMWKARQRDLYILDSELRLRTIFNLNNFDPSPKIESDLGNHYQFLKNEIMKTFDKSGIE